ncbi:ABC transporter ATP-binding protein [Gracilibacillus halophilus YIM-C55.5]|uniref:ABC transporter ATP-binding protein n=1 Tax=Gracilibacillus halophilus YIM-C55.5 TaxID=1308866 RepID=N4W8T4_9BACI|nr:urea ABC transporter ATP-binding subunit UrtE [Gracilibacillus halophilus]ENH95619.1 ABC transporter ATP-binding protein [Gracilibacillus halophilus YIM-C55.5]
MLTIQELEAGYDESMVIRDINMHVDDNQVICVMGRNGVGKTTLLKTVIGILHPEHGSIQFNQTDMTTLKPSQRAKMGIGYIPQGREIFPKLTVHDNLLLGLEAGDQKTIDEKVYAYFPILKDFTKRNGGDLSGGQQQQLAIARALVSQPSFLLLDEPTEGIQPNIVQEIQDVILDIKQSSDTSMILVEQNLDFVKNVADYVYVMDHGSIVYESAVDDIEDETIYRYLSV